MQGIVILLVALLIGLFLYAYSSCGLRCKNSEGYRFGGGGYFDQCEYNEDCAGNLGKTGPMSNGMTGVCVMNGKICPSFSTDTSRQRFYGLDPNLVENDFNKLLRRYYHYKD